MSRFLSLLVVAWGLTCQPGWGQLFVPSNAPRRQPAEPNPSKLDAATAKGVLSEPANSKCEISRAARTCSTAIEFYLPQDAIKLAKHESKLLMILHLSGNFEKANFT